MSRLRTFKAKPTFAKQLGLTITEVLVSTAVGVILLGGVMTIMSNNKAIFLSQESLSRLKENGRFARFMLQRDIRMAGFQGCNNSKTLTAKNQINSPNDAQTMIDANNIIGFRGLRSGWMPQIPGWVMQNIPTGTNVLAGTDVITIRKLNSEQVPLSKNMISQSIDVDVLNRANFAENDVLFITDCEEIDIFKATVGTTNVKIKHDSTGNRSSSFTKAYQTDAYVGRLETYTYYIRSSGRTNKTGRPINVLARQDIRGNEIVLIDGIDNMKITYGIDTLGDDVPDTFVTADVVQARNAWDKVLSVRFALLLNSIEEVGKPNQRYVFNGRAQIGSDRLLRRQWDVYVNLRNRSL